VRDFNYVDDAVRAFLLAAARDEAVGSLFNLGSEEVVSLRELAELLLELAGGGSYRLVRFPDERRSFDIGDYYSDFSRIRAELGWEPTTALRGGLRRTLEFYREHGASIGRSCLTVPFLDLSRQAATIRRELEEAIAEVLDGGQFVLGRQVSQFEQDFATYAT
jgi:hypothetical protein